MSKGLFCHYLKLYWFELNNCVVQYFTLLNFLSDPRIRDTASSAVDKLIQGAQEIQADVQANVGRFVNADAAAGHEIFFLIDVSKSILNPELNATLTFAVRLVQRVSIILCCYSPTKMLM